MAEDSRSDSSARYAERRLVRRHEIDGLTVRWISPKTRRFGRSPKPVDVELVDLSITGAQVRAPESIDVQRGTRLHLELDDQLLPAIARSVRDGVCGIEFVGLTPEVQALVGDIADAWASGR